MKLKSYAPPMIDALKSLWAATPELRFCQLVANIAEQDDIFYISDEEFYNKMRKYAEKLIATSSSER